MLTMENLEKSKVAHRRFIEKKDGQRSNDSWAETLTSGRLTAARLQREGVLADDVESLLAIIDEAKSLPKKQHINGLTTLICYSSALKEEISDSISDWMEDVGIKNLSSTQALSNIDAYQISPVRRIVSFLYVAQLGEDGVFEAINNATKPESIERLMKIHKTSFFVEKTNSKTVELAELKIKGMLSQNTFGTINPQSNRPRFLTGDYRLE